jgi:hypothetical protein
VELDCGYGHSKGCFSYSVHSSSDRKWYFLQGDHNHLFIRQGTGLQGQAVFRTKLTFRPHSTESFTHRKMTLSLADRSQKTSGIKVLSQVGWDPEQNRGQMIKASFSSICNVITFSFTSLHIIQYKLRRRMLDNTLKLIEVRLLGNN